MLSGEVPAVTDCVSRLASEEFFGTLNIEGSCGSRWHSSDGNWRLRVRCRNPRFVTPGEEKQSTHDWSETGGCHLRFAFAHHTIPLQPGNAEMVLAMRQFAAQESLGENEHSHRNKRNAQYRPALRAAVR